MEIPAYAGMTAILHAGPYIPTYYCLRKCHSGRAYPIGFNQTLARLHGNDGVINTIVTKK